MGHTDMLNLTPDGGGHPLTPLTPDTRSATRDGLHQIANFNTQTAPMRSFLSYGRADRKSNFKTPTGKITPFTSSHDVTSLFLGQYAVPRAPNRQTAGSLRDRHLPRDATGRFCRGCRVPVSRLEPFLDLSTSKAK